MKWFRAVGIYLAGQLALFVIVKWIFRATWGELIGPYLAFAASMATTFFIVWFLNNWASRKATPRQFALGAGLCAAFLALSADGAFAYLGLALGLINQQFISDWTNWMFIVLPLTLVFSMVVYRGAYRTAKARHANTGIAAPFPIKKKGAG
jgi:hypothetical protein